MKNVFISDLRELKSFILFEEPVEFKGFRAVGYFPYETAQLNYKECVAAPRSVFAEIENILARTRYMDNKVVIVFEDTTDFGTDNFAIQFKDAYCKMGMLNQIIGYAGTELK